MHGTDKNQLNTRSTKSITSMASKGHITSRFGQGKTKESLHLREDRLPAGLRRQRRRRSRWPPQQRSLPAVALPRQLSQTPLLPLVQLQPATAAVASRQLAHQSGTHARKREAQREEVIRGVKVKREPNIEFEKENRCAIQRYLIDL